MIHEIEDIDGYKYIKTTFRFAEDKDILNEIITRAAKLSGDVSPYGPDGELRNLTERINKNIGGLLAEEALKEYIKNKIESEHLNAKIVEISEQKEEIIIGNISWNQIDIVLEVNGKIKNIEIRSSFSYYAHTVQRLFKQGGFSLIGWYTHKHKPIEKEKDYYILAIHYYHPSEIQQKIKNEIVVYIACAASKSILKEKGVDSDLKQKDAKFHIIHPLISVPDPIIVIDEILEIKQIKRQSELIGFFKK